MESKDYIYDWGEFEALSKLANNCMEKLYRRIIMEDNWKHRSKGMTCSTCMWFVKKNLEDDKDLEELGTVENKRSIGRCRRHAPTMNGWPVMFESDFCGDHKLDENRI